MLVELTRRKFMGLLSALHLMLGGRAHGAETAMATERLPIHDLHLSPDELQELESYAVPVIQAARALDDLDLGNLPVSAIEPTLLFEPERFYAGAALAPSMPPAKGTRSNDE